MTVVKWTEEEVTVINKILRLIHAHNIEYLEDLEKIITEHEEFTKTYEIVRKTHIIPKIKGE